MARTAEEAIRLANLKRKRRGGATQASGSAKHGQAQQGSASSPPAPAGFRPKRPKRRPARFGDDSSEGSAAQPSATSARGGDPPGGPAEDPREFYRRVARGEVPLTVDPDEYRRRFAAPGRRSRLITVIARRRIMRKRRGEIADMRESLRRSAVRYAALDGGLGGTGQNLSMQGRVGSSNSTNMSDRMNNTSHHSMTTMPNSSPAGYLGSMTPVTHTHGDGTAPSSRMMREMMVHMMAAMGGSSGGSGGSGGSGSNRSRSNSRNPGGLPSVPFRDGGSGGGSSSFGGGGNTRVGMPRRGILNAPGSGGTDGSGGSSGGGGGGGGGNNFNMNDDLISPAPFQRPAVDFGRLSRDRIAMGGGGFGRSPGGGMAMGDLMSPADGLDRETIKERIMMMRGILGRSGGGGAGGFGTMPGGGLPFPVRTQFGRSSSGSGGGPSGPVPGVNSLRDSGHSLSDTPRNARQSGMSFDGPVGAKSPKSPNPKKGFLARERIMEAEMRSRMSEALANFRGQQAGRLMSGSGGAADGGAAEFRRQMSSNSHSFQRQQSNPSGNFQRQQSHASENFQRQPSNSTGKAASRPTPVPSGVPSAGPGGSRPGMSDAEFLSRMADLQRMQMRQMMETTSGGVGMGGGGGVPFQAPTVTAMLQMLAAGGSGGSGLMNGMGGMGALGGNNADVMSLLGMGGGTGAAGRNADVMSLLGMGGGAGAAGRNADVLSLLQQARSGAGLPSAGAAAPSGGASKSKKGAAAGGAAAVPSGQFTKAPTVKQVPHQNVGDKPKREFF